MIFKFSLTNSIYLINSAKNEAFGMVKVGPRLWAESDWG